LAKVAPRGSSNVRAANIRLLGRAGLGLSESEAELEIASDAPGKRAFSA
jgi:hypothetical protein